MYNKVLEAIRLGEFDGISHSYKSYSGYGEMRHQLEMNISDGSIEVAKITTGKGFNGERK